MMIDDEPQTHTNHLDAAHVQLCQLAMPLLKAAAASVVERERERLVRNGSNASIHSQSRNAGYRSVSELPSMKELESADAKTCLTLAWRLSKADKPWASLMGFLIPFGERGARRGRDYARGDWTANAAELVRLGEAVDSNDIIQLGREVQAWAAAPT